MKIYKRTEAFCRAKGKSGAKDAVYETAQELKTKVFDTKIHEATIVKEAQGMQVSLIQHAPESKPFVDYQKLTKELLKAMG